MIKTKKVVKIYYKNKDFIDMKYLWILYLTFHNFQ